MNHFVDEWSKLGASFDGIHTGFVTGKEQIENIFSFLHTFYKEGTTLLVDPVTVIGARCMMLYQNELIDFMKELVKRADIITPNVTECCLLTGLPYDKLKSYRGNEDYLLAIEEAGRSLKSATNASVIITGLNPPGNSETRYVGNMFIDGSRSFHSLQEYNGESYSGTGDLFASVIMGGMMRGQDVAETMKLAERFLTASIEATSKEQVPSVAGVNFELFLRMLI